MGGPAPDQQIIAGVLLGERLAVTMYGGIHRAQHAGQRNLRGLVIDAKMLAEDGFRRALTDQKGIQSTLALDHKNIVPAVAVESEGPEVVVVTKGTGRYVTAQDLISAARSGKQKRLAPAIVGAVGKAVVDALAIAHAAGVVHGAVHPRSVLIDEQGDVRLGDFVVGRALTTAVAQGADSALWRGLAGYIAPELVVGEDPTPQVDVFAVGALLFTMITGEVQPGPMNTTPAVGRFVTRALDTDVSRRYASAKELLENFVEALEDDKWEIADKGELIKAAGLSATDGNIDDATEDLLASLGSSAVQVMPTRPSMDIHAAAVAARHKKTDQPTTGGRLDALLADLDEHDGIGGMTNVDEAPMPGGDPISELIKLDPRKAEALVPNRRVPTFDADDDDDDVDASTVAVLGKPDFSAAAAFASVGTSRSEAATTAPPMRSNKPRSASMDESAALDALDGLDEPGRRMSTAAEQATNAADRLEAAAKRAEAAATILESGPSRISSNSDTLPRQATDTIPDTRRPKRPDNDETPPTTPGVVSKDLLAATKPIPRRAAPIVDPIRDDAPTPKLHSPVKRIIGGLLVVGIIGGGGYLVINNFAKQDERAEADKARQEELLAAQQKKDAEDRKRHAQEEADAEGAISLSSNPPDAGVWLRIGRTPCSTMNLSGATSHEFAILSDEKEVTHVQVLSQHWASDPTKGAVMTATLLPAKTDPKTKKLPPLELPLQPPARHLDQTGPAASAKGPIKIESSPTDAEVWMFVGITGSMRFNSLYTGREYELVVSKPGFKQKRVSIKADDWKNSDQTKKKVIEQTVELEKK